MPEMYTTSMGKRLLTLVLLLDGKRILLGMKKRSFGAGRWNGFGGKLELGESIDAAARREVAEEAGVIVGELTEVGVLTFSFDGQEEVFEVHVFTATSWEGTPSESSEMRPEWFALDAIPYNTMWLDDPYWLPLVLKGKSVHGTFHFKDQQHLVSHHVEVE